MTAKKLYILLICLCLSTVSFAQEKIGLVLSGGGASGFAHIGVLKALEENGIPIDYITGTSAGALVGSLYAVGYSPEEIEAFVLSDDFQLMSNGAIHREHEFLLRKEEAHAGMISFSFAKDSILKKSLPTNFTSSALLDYEMMRLLGTASASIGNDFNQLFVPFRCVAADITLKESVVFDKGNLNAAVRASMTYPFYLKPIKINGTLLFDGGLYNNFPADVMYHDFNPDYIIGSNVSYNAAPPDEDDLISQITNMLVSHSDFQLPCEEGLVIEPPSLIATFEFDKIDEAIKTGYDATIAALDSLCTNITRRVTKEELRLRREKFRSQIIPLSVSSIATKSEKKALRYTKGALIKRRRYERLDPEVLERRYFRLYSAPQIDFIYPTLSLIDDSTYNLNIEVRKAKEFNVDVGGHISSRPVNTGYIGLTYQTISKLISSTKLESYFGKFYGSAKASVTLDLPVVYPITASAYFTLNRWDYFRSFATFFEDVQPSFLVQNEMYTGLELNLPIRNTLKGSIDGRIFQLDDRYYQTESFTNKDTADHTNFYGYSLLLSIEQNTLNRKQFATGGHFFRLHARLVEGKEHSVSGSTAPTPFDVTKVHQWINVGLDYQSFVIDAPFYHLGLHGQMVFNSQTQFANYTATLLSLTEFSLLPDVKSYFLPEYRSPQFIAVGMNHIFTVRKKIDLRFDGYLFQPFVQLILNDDGTQQLSKPFKGETYLASASVIYNSFVGPIRFTANYFPKQEFPIEIQFSMGYVIFNNRAIR